MVSPTHIDKGQAADHVVQSAATWFSNSVKSHHAKTGGMRIEQCCA